MPPDVDTDGYVTALVLEQRVEHALSLRGLQATNDGKFRTSFDP